MEQKSNAPKPSSGWLIFGAAAVGLFALGFLASSITERRAEAPRARVQFNQELATFEADNAKWGQSFQREYNSWESTKSTNANSKYAGSDHRDYLAENPNLVVMWAGYPFSIDYNQARGHFHAVDDVKATKRIGPKTPGTCYTCKSPDVPRVMDKVGVAEFYKAPFKDWDKEIVNPIGCADCHDNKTMALRISRPALKEAFERQGKDITKATHQEMRSLVCAQCHVEYYFKGKKENYLTFPWDKGMGSDDIISYYYDDPDPKVHRDWTHAISGARMIKMQHPDYEVYKQGIHAFRGVSCADCHMPYKSEGGIKYTDHQIQSPLYNIANSCQVCHKWSEADVKSRVESIQDKNRELLSQAEKEITLAHLEIGFLKSNGATEGELDQLRTMVSKAQAYWDYVAATNGMGFHAPHESARTLSKATQIAMECRIKNTAMMTKKGLTFAMPDVATKEKAQAYIKPYADAAKAAAAAKEAAEKAAAAKTQAASGQPKQG